MDIGSEEIAVSPIATTVSLVSGGKGSKFLEFFFCSTVTRLCAIFVDDFGEKIGYFLGKFRCKKCAWPKETFTK